MEGPRDGVVDPQTQAIFAVVTRSRTDPIVAIAPDGVIASWSDGAQTLYGYSSEQVVGRHFSLLVAPDHRDLELALLRHVLNGAPVEQFRTSRVTRSGETIAVSLWMRRQTDSAGNVVGIASLSAVEQGADSYQLALAESEIRLRQMVDNVPVAMTLRNLDPPDFLYVSPGFVQIFGYDPQVLGENPFGGLQRVHPDDRALVELHYYAPIQRGEAAQLEFRFLRSDGTVRWIRASNTPIRDANGTVVRGAGTAEDITDRKQAEEAAHAARSEAERANSAKSEFLSRMSHELRTPLNAVLGFAQLLELDALSEEQEDSVQHILLGARHLLAMINDVLDISRIETDQLEISAEPVEISDLIGEVQDLMRPLASESGILLHYPTRAADFGCFIQADRRRLAQVLLNLISNAIKYNQRGGRVQLNCVLGDDGLRIAVTDTGFGIQPEYFERLFTPFDRLDRESLDIEGTGIGLALSRRLVDVMGGTMHVTSTVAVGSTFTVVMPVTEARYPPQYQQDVLTAAATAATVTGVPSVPVTAAPVEPTLDLLYVEDNVSNVQLMERILERRPSWRMVHVGHGALALEMARSLMPQLVLLDLHLPDMTGAEILLQLRADPATAHLPVAMVSADASPHQIERLRALGAIDYLTKPLNVADVFQLLDNYACNVRADPNVA